jgi:hypothetical protein
MTNAAVALLRRRWASLMAWVAAMDYSAADYTNDRIGGLEREVEQLKDELTRTRTPGITFPQNVAAKKPLNSSAVRSGISSGKK